MFNDGVTIGLQLWVLFLAFFFLTGYSAMFSIGLGAIAGFAGGFISAYIRAKAQVPPPPPSEDDTESPLKRAQNRIQKWRKDGEDSRKQANTLGRKRRRSLKSPRRSS